MRNKILTIVVLLALALGAYFLFVRDSAAPTDSEGIELEEGTSADFRGDPKNATFVFEDGSVTLEEGRLERDIVQGSALKEEIYLTGQAAYGDVDGDSKDDAAVVLIRSGGGSGSFIYVSALVSGAINYTGTNAILIGDRVTPEEISISNSIITVEYLDRGPDEPLAAEPTIAKVKRYAYRSGELVEI